ncbi:MAG TPA: hypothetical protein VHZ55_23295 [Bryobacteraceae bacterium]|jgi:hypothetical protein|nr:hypothetical protein [Bryobacteraceae bacterium]
MAVSKIKKKSSGAKASAVPKQGALPCLIVIALILLVVGLVLYFSLRGAG